MGVGWRWYKVKTPDRRCRECCFWETPVREGRDQVLSLLFGSASAEEAGRQEVSVLWGEKRGPGKRMTRPMEERVGGAGGLAHGGGFRSLARVVLVCANVITGWGLSAVRWWCGTKTGLGNDFVKGGLARPRNGGLSGGCRAIRHNENHLLAFILYRRRGGDFPTK